MRVRQQQGQRNSGSMCTKFTSLLLLVVVLLGVVLNVPTTKAFSPHQKLPTHFRHCSSHMHSRKRKSTVSPKYKYNGNVKLYVESLVILNESPKSNNIDENGSTRSTAVTATNKQDTSSLSTSNNTCTPLNLQLLEKQLSNCQTGTAARRVLESTLSLSNTSTDSNKRKQLYKSIVIPPDASSRGLSDGDLAIQTRIRNTRYNVMDVIDLNGNRDADRASVAVASVFVGSTLSALVANQNLPGPDILRFLVVWAFSFAPLALVGYGIATPDSLQATLVQLQRLVFPKYRQRMIEHEAGHFLMAHLLGYPIQTYQANAVKNAVTFYPLNDPDIGPDRAQQLGFDTTSSTNKQRPHTDATTITMKDIPSFFSPEGRGSTTLQEQSVFRKETERIQKKMNYTAFLQLQTQETQYNPRQVWPYRGLEDATLDQLTVISVAGVCAEILAFGNAEGGFADFSQLKLILANAEAPLNERDVDNRIRFAVGYTMSQLRRHLGALDALADVMERDGTIAECIYAIEMCHNSSGNDGILQEYEVRRKIKFQENSNNPIYTIVEKVFLGDIKTADVQEDRLIQGKGGGYIKKRGPLLTGDDPLYLALGVATVFLLWASSGGLTLH